jgi:hypothetical protein
VTRENIKNGATHSETKLVRRDEQDDSPVLRRSSVPPTICLTFPSCRSIQGRNWDLLRGAFVVVVADMVYERQDEDGDGRWSNASITLDGSEYWARDSISPLYSLR